MKNTSGDNQQSTLNPSWYHWAGLPQSDSDRVTILSRFIFNLRSPIPEISG
ncbi:MAG: hypothetical protein RM338_04025 [Nostoc sp. DedQUE12a]|nr:hypothetical protein [Nostoc sp. DedQUE12a]